MKEPSSALTAEMRAAIEAKLDSIPAEKRQVFYTVLVGRIDAAIAKSLSKKQHKTAAALREIRAMVIERLNETE
ncbi:MAG TPA: hypothetical protein PK765_00330 [bacterium]|nr:hypothetical protein [bacterium]